MSCTLCAYQDISSKKGDFLSLSIDGVKVILDSDALMVSYEEEVFQILLDWLNANCRTMDEKQQAAEEAATVVRFPWMTGDFLIDVVSTNPQMQGASCQVGIASGYSLPSLSFTSLISFFSCRGLSLVLISVFLFRPYSALMFAF